MSLSLFLVSNKFLNLKILGLKNLGQKEILGQKVLYQCFKTMFFFFVENPAGPAKSFVKKTSGPKIFWFRKKFWVVNF